MREPGPGFALLDGVRVLDLTGSIAGPYAAMLLGDFGADVVKVERPDAPDDARGWGPPFLDGESLWFLSVNRNKRAIALDPARDLQTLGALIAAADVLVVSQPLRVLRKLGLTPEAAQAPQQLTNADRRADRAGIVAHIQTILRKRPRAEWLGRET